jgi:hypothetical protein
MRRYKDLRKGEDSLSVSERAMGGEGQERGVLRHRDGRVLYNCLHVDPASANQPFTLPAVRPAMNWRESIR